MPENTKIPNEYKDCLEKIAEGISDVQKTEGVPYIEFTIKEPINLGKKHIEKGENVLFADGTIVAKTNQDGTPNFTKNAIKTQDCKKAEIGNTVSKNYVAKVMSPSSPNYSHFRNKLIESNIPFSMSTYQNNRTKAYACKFTFNKKFVDKVTTIDEDTKRIAKGIPSKVQKSQDSDTFSLIGNAFAMKSPYANEKYIAEFCKAPDELIDKKRKVIEKINEQIVKCETFLGQLREAHIAGDAVGFETAREGLKKEFDALKALERKEILEDNLDIGIYGKLVDLQAIKNIENAINDLNNVANIAPINALDNKLKEHKRENAFVIHLRCMMELAAHGNLSGQEVMDTVSSRNSNHTISIYGNSTRISYTAGREIENSDNAISEIRENGSTMHKEDSLGDPFDDAMSAAEKSNGPSIDDINKATEEDEREDPHQEKTRI